MYMDDITVTEVMRTILMFMDDITVTEVMRTKLMLNLFLLKHCLAMKNVYNDSACI
jgi:hypothetical protein